MCYDTHCMTLPEQETSTPNEELPTHLLLTKSTARLATKNDLGVFRETGLPSPAETNPYSNAEEIFNARVEVLKQSGEMRRLSEITDDWDLDDHFDQLSRVYRKTCIELGLPWPPIPIEDVSRDKGVNRIESTHAVEAEPELEPPSLEQLMQWEREGICEATDGCVVEPDGVCPHGCQSWLLELRLI